MKKILYAALVTALVFALGSCGGDKPPVTTDPVVSSDVTTAPVVTEPTSDAPQSSATEPTETTEPTDTTVPDGTTATEPVVTAPTGTTATDGTTVTEPVVTEPTDTTAPAVTDTPIVTEESTETSGEDAPEEPFDFAKSDLTPYFELGKYLGIEVPVAEAPPVTDADVAKRLTAAVANLPAEAMITSRAAEMGDTVSVDFVGMMDGVAFEGGSASGFMLTLGSDALIDGFEDGICGMQPGEEKQLDLVFPADYNPAYAGKAAIFTVRLNHIYPTPNDAIAVQYWNAESLDAYRATLRAELEGEAQAAFEIAKEEAAWTKALANSRVIQYPEAALNEAFENNVRVYEQLAEMYHMTYEEIFPTFYGLSVADAETILFNSAKNLTAQRLLLYAVSKDMGLDVSDEKFDAELAATAAVLGLDSVDTLIKQLGKSKTALKEDKLYAEVITKITAEANFVVSAS